MHVGIAKDIPDYACKGSQGHRCHTIAMSSPQHYWSVHSSDDTPP